MVFRAEIAYDLWSSCWKVCFESRSSHPEGFRDQLQREFEPMNMNVSLGGPIQAISIQVSPEVEVQLVAGEAKWYEYNRVPYSNLVAGQYAGLGRDETHQKLKEFFPKNPQARYVARIAKALFIPLVKDLPKRPWSLILTHMVYRECVRNKRANTTDFGGVGLFRDLLTDIVSYGCCKDESSVAMVARWAKNSEGSDNAFDVVKPLTRWRDFVFKKIGDKRLQEKKGENSCCQISGVLTPCNLPPSKNSGREFEVADFISELTLRLSLSSSFGKRSCKESNFCTKKTPKFQGDWCEALCQSGEDSGWWTFRLQGSTPGDFREKKNPEKKLQLTLGVEKKWNSGWCFFVKIWNLDCIIRLIWLKFWFSPDFEVFFFMVKDVHHSVIVEGFVFSCAGVTPGIGWSYVQQGYHAPEDEKGDHQSSSFMAALTHVFHDEMLRKPLILRYASGSMPESYTQRAGFLAHFESQMLDSHKTTHEQGCLARLPPGVQEGRKQLGSK